MATTTGTAQWGVNASQNGVTGIVTDFSEEVSGSFSPEYNEKGAVVKQTKYDDLTTLTCTVEVATNVTAPAPGTAIKINNKDGYVTRARIVESNRAYRRIEITAEFYTNCNTATVESSSSGSGSGSGNT